MIRSIFKPGEILININTGHSYIVHSKESMIFHRFSFFSVTKLFSTFPKRNNRTKAFLASTNIKRA